MFNYTMTLKREQAGQHGRIVMKKPEIIRKGVELGAPPQTFKTSPTSMGVSMD
jgi:hypothetical protein